MERKKEMEGRRKGYWRGGGEERQKKRGRNRKMERRGERRIISEGKGRWEKEEGMESER